MPKAKKQQDDSQIEEIDLSSFDISSIGISDSDNVPHNKDIVVDSKSEKKTKESSHDEFSFSSSSEENDDFVI